MNLTPADKAAKAKSFAKAARAYERSRPSYPPEAVDWILPPSAKRVLDLAAGTGKLTRLLSARGLDVVAVEPLAEMRAELARALPHVTALEGSAERIPLPDASVDAVTVAQAWHWFDPARAVPEIARVLTPGGTLGLLRNRRDESVDWVVELGDIIHHFHPRDLKDEPVIGPPFAAAERREVQWRAMVPPRMLLELTRSRSTVIVRTDEEQTALLAELEGLIATHPALAGKSEIAFPYSTSCVRARLA